ncbi:serine/threonine-protein kinase [Nocardia sp. NPDC005978]|uniref:serine/threonine-protein kinase n=1 Tax=Nocardia sp. NPDC005978 TaxID=3156725 RepID=UPI0033AE9F1D
MVETFGRYRLQRLLGSGGMGQVWLAHDVETDRVVALKVLPAELAADDNYRARFAREARIAARLRGPHLVTIHTFGEIDSRLFIDMEYIEGTDVAALLRDDGPMSPAMAVDIITQTAAALDAVHRAGLIHRDVKPANIVVHPSGFVYLIDFGTAHHVGHPTITATGQVVGTLAYLAPERLSGTVDSRSDIYSLACVLYECLTGLRPFGDTDPARQVHDHLGRTPPRAGEVNARVPSALDEIIARGMAKEPDRRYAGASAFARAAASALTGAEQEPAPAVTTAATDVARPAVPVGRRSGSTRGRVCSQRITLIALALSLIAMIAGVVLMIDPLEAESRNDSVASESAPPASEPFTISPTQPAPPSPTASEVTTPFPRAGQACEPVVAELNTETDGAVPKCADSQGSDPQGERTGGRPEGGAPVDPNEPNSQGQPEKPKKADNPNKPQKPKKPNK